MGNPVARLILQARRWRDHTRWQLLDAGAELQDFVDRLPEGEQYLSIEPGWYELLAEAHRQMNAIDDQYLPMEAKEKWGELRISVRDRDGQLNVELFDACREARDLSMTTCEWSTGATDSEPRAGHPSRLCEPCRGFERRWNDAWREASR